MRVVILALLLTLVVSPAHAVTVTRVVSPGGIEAWLVEDHANPVIALELSFSGSGATADPVGKEGLAYMASSLLDEGAGDMDSLAFQTKVEDLSIHFSFDSIRDNFSAGLKTLTENRDTAFDLFRLALTQPRFDPDAVERVRAQIFAVLKREAEDPDTVAAKAWFRTVYPDHPYGRSNSGSEASIKAITLADLKAFPGARFGRDRMIIGVAGDITADQLKGLLDRTFGTLPAKAAVPTIPDQAPAAKGQIIVMDKAIPQSIGMFGHGGVRRADPDWYAAYILNYVMGGGGFSSRLMEEVREKRGLAYSVYSYLYPLDHSAVYLGGVATRNARFGESLTLIREHWRRMAQEGPTAEELKNAKTYLTGSWPLQLDGTGQIAAVLVVVQRDGLGIDYLDKRNGYLEAVTLEDARRVAKRLFQPDALTVVVVGQPEGVTATAK
ncbi:MAG: insulinase family protein [Alphaproteobacteria bacterium]